MKKILPLIIAAILIAAGIFMYHKHESEPPSLEVSIMSDITDSLIVRPDTSCAFELFDFQRHKWDKLLFRAQAITNYDYNPVSACSLAASFTLLSNPAQRDNEVAQFKNEIASACSSLNSATGTLPHSSVYIPIIRELNRLSGSAAVERILVVYSDLIENTSDLSLYGKHNTVGKCNDSLLAKLKRAAKLNDLANVTVYFIYRPRKDADHDYFKRMVAIYTQLLEDAGARVHVGANVVVSKSHANES